MYNGLTLGVTSDYEPKSNSFDIDIINQEIDLDKEILNISKITLSINSKAIDIFTSLDSVYVNILLYIHIKIEYISKDKSINYKITNINKFINICCDEDKYIKDITLYPAILDFSVSNITLNKICIYILHVCSIN